MKRLGLLLVMGCAGKGAPDSPMLRPPNLIFILADDLGYGELGCYGQKKIRTPRLDRMAAEGMRFTNFYSGNAVCAPSRCVLMTGKHPGHAWVRTNVSVQPEGQTPLPAAEVTIAELLKERGYATGCAGKWGLGPPGSEGDPNRQGFDLFYGFNCQGHAHNHYPTYLYRNSERIGLPGNDGTWTGRQYSHDLMEAEGLQFIRDHRDRPFFLYMAFTIPHVAMQVPDDSLAEYKGKWEETPYLGKGYLPHLEPRAAHAAMITRLDRSVGRILDLLRQLGLDERTVVMFSSDNGSIDKVGGHDLPFFEANGVLRGQKGTLYEGGIRVPFLARWPGKIPAGAVNADPWAFWDVLPTLLHLADGKAPAGGDGLSFLAALLGRPGPTHPFLYWEFPSSGGQQAVRMGKWKGIRTGLQQRLTALELYDLEADLSESRDAAAQNAGVVREVESIMTREHVRSELFPIKALDGAR
jgi:arylsulfatase